MIRALFVGCFAASALVGAWVLYMLGTWLIHGCPDRFD